MEETEECAMSTYRRRKRPTTLRKWFKRNIITIVLFAIVAVGFVCLIGAMSNHALSDTTATPVDTGTPIPTPTNESTPTMRLLKKERSRQALCSKTIRFVWMTSISLRHPFPLRRKVRLHPRRLSRTLLR